MKLLAAILLVVAALAAGSGYGATERAGHPSAPLSPEQRDILNWTALEVRSGSDMVLRAWFREAIPVRPPAAESKRKATYRDIEEGKLIGVVEFPKVFTDYRRQRIPAGLYTMRYAVQPNTGEHTDTAPHREFFLLTAASDDRGVERMEPKRLIALSRKINEGTHPALLLLWPITDRDANASIIAEVKGVLAVAVRRTGDAGGRKTPLGFAITVAGTRKL
jgi:hypothetical protein